MLHFNTHSQKGEMASRNQKAVEQDKSLYISKTHTIQHASFRLPFTSTIADLREVATTPLPLDRVNEFSDREECNFGGASPKYLAKHPLDKSVT